MPISLSNVLLVCSSCSKPTRTGARLRDDGSKERYCKKCGAAIGAIAPRRSEARSKARKVRRAVRNGVL